ncbi:MAG: BMP family ABC transporter substrate-binding protein, partial [bacterium]
MRMSSLFRFSLLGLISLLLATTPLFAGPFKVGLVTDVGRVNDRSFNQSAWEGVLQAQKKLGLGDRDVKYIETQ